MEEPTRRPFGCCCVNIHSHYRCPVNSHYVPPCSNKSSTTVQPSRVVPQICVRVVPKIHAVWRNGGFDKLYIVILLYEYLCDTIVRAARGPRSIVPIKRGGAPVFCCWGLGMNPFGILYDDA